MKNYFNYGSDILSKDSSEAIAMVKGCGPIIGFGSAVIDTQNDQLEVSPLPASTDPMYKIMLGKQKQWYITKANDDTEANQTTFAGIAKDGCIFSLDNNVLEVSISGTKGAFNEVILFAVHNPVADLVSNPVSFMAYWSGSSSSFFDLYQRSIDPYYPQAAANRTYDFDSHDGTDSDLNYNNLETLVAAACPAYVTNKDSWAIMGIYGTGNNPVTGVANEAFALVPYDGSFPNHLQYTPGIHNSLKHSLSRVEKLLSGVSNTETDTPSLKEILNDFENNLLEKIRKEIALATLPVGSIILWRGDTIPDGWREYTLAQGRVVVGFSDGGIQVPISINRTETQTILGSVEQTYNPVDGDYFATLDSANIPKHVHGMGITKGRMENARDADISTVQGWANRDTSLNGDVGYYQEDKTIGVVKGGIISSKNFDDPSGAGQSEVSAGIFNITKLPKAIALRYIIKVSDSTYA